MQQFRLKNGRTIIYHNKPTSSVAIEITIKTGSNNETHQIGGISHFIEHVVFEGTKNHETSKELANEIEKYGGELNAYTSEERTAFYVKIIKKHFQTALDVLEDIVFTPLFKEEAIEKERKIILDEIKMVTDEPRFYQWVLFSKTLFKKHPSKNPIYGTKESVSKITKEDLLNYYHTYYIPNNMVITIVGQVENIKKKIQEQFSKYEKRKIKQRKKVNEPKQTKQQRKTEKRHISSSYAVLGYKTPNRLDKESYSLDIIRAILGRGQSGKIFYEIRTKRGLAYDVGVHHEPEKDCGLFAEYFATNKKNIDKIIQIVLEEFRKLQNTTKQELEEAKDFVEGAHLLHIEENHRLADETSYWALMGNPKLAENYVQKIRKATLSDIKRAAKKYLTKNYTLTIVEQK